MIDLSKLGRNSTSAMINPRDIFMSLPAKDKRYEYPRDVQSEVWKQWFEKRDRKNNVIKMNTGSGKTVVSLVILKSCLNEGVGPVVYVVPDNYLIEQVRDEANKLGISVTTEVDDAMFLRGKSILIVNIYKLINGKSVFGMRRSNNIAIGSIVIDDVHACMGIIEKQYSITIERKSDNYSLIVNLFSDSLKKQSFGKCSEITEGTKSSEIMLVPFWSWQEKIDEVYKILNQAMDDDEVLFHFPLIKASLHLCNCVISSRKIEISPKSIPIDNIKSFQSAQRKIFLSATLSDDSALVSALGVDPKEIEKIISPEKANDIGDRLFLFPKIMNRNVTEQSIRIRLKELSAKYNTIVITPSKKQADLWDGLYDAKLDSENISEGVSALRNGHVGLVVFSNKYDGIDLPDDACRILVIDGYPRVNNLYDEYVQDVDPLNKNLLSEQIQKIEQGMGRGTRSNNDYCVIVLLGSGLSDVLYAPEGMNYFSDATKKQYELSQELWEQLHSPNINQIFDLCDYSLKRNIDWISACKEALSSLIYPSDPQFSKMTIANRIAFNSAEQTQYQKAYDTLISLSDKTEEPKTKGYIKQLAAEYINFIDPVKAQEVLKSAITSNKYITKPINGIQFERALRKASTQSQNIVSLLNDKNIVSNKLLLKVSTLLEILIFEPETAFKFEEALMEIFKLIGINAYRPEANTGKGPDNFMDLGNSSFLVAECKNGTVTETISKQDCNQLNGSIEWFRTLYPDTSNICLPIMIHNSNVFGYECSPKQTIRIMTPELLEKFKYELSGFFAWLCSTGSFSNPTEIAKNLIQFKLRGEDIVGNFTQNFKLQSRR